MAAALKTININPQRIDYLLRLFNLEKDELLGLISEGLKNPIPAHDVFTPIIKISHLKKIDKIFDKGLSFYTDPTPIADDREDSIFFRKSQFNSELELGDRQIVNKIEDDVCYLLALSKLSNYPIERVLPRYKIADSAVKAAESVGEHLHINTVLFDKDFMKAFINALSRQNVLVVEFVEAWNKKHKTSIDGLFIAPHTIGIKRNQGSFRREIFTLAHELGHYLLEQEDLDKLGFNPTNLDAIEKWCNEFAFNFLVGKDAAQRILSIPAREIAFDNSIIDEVSRDKHISRLALFAHLASEGRITWDVYDSIKADLDADYARKNEKKEERKRLGKLRGEESGGGAPQKIISHLERDICLSAFHEGVIEEYELLTHLNKKVLDASIYE